MSKLVRFLTMAHPGHGRAAYWATEEEFNELRRALDKALTPRQRQRVVLEYESPEGATVVVLLSSDWDDWGFIDFVYGIAKRTLGDTWID